MRKRQFGRQPTVFCSCRRCSSVSVIAFGSTHATTAEHSRMCTVLQLDRSSGCSGSQRQISDGVSTLTCGRLSGKRKGISLALQIAGEDFGTSPAPESQRKAKTNAYTTFAVSEVGMPCTTLNGPSAAICPVAFGFMTEPVCRVPPLKALQHHGETIEDRNLTGPQLYRKECVNVAKNDRHCAVVINLQSVKAEFLR